VLDGTLREHDYDELKEAGKLEELQKTAADVKEYQPPKAEKKK